ncbi:MAG: hypothetical protein Q4A41_04060 [Bacillota bacterium]|nr:hypothetical protein [Bacillota bacterium]
MEENFSKHDDNGKRKKKHTGTIVLLLIVGIIIGILIPKSGSPNSDSSKSGSSKPAFSSNHALVYSSNEKVYLVKHLMSKEKIEIPGAYSKSNRHRHLGHIYFSPDSKYLYYFTKIDSYADSGLGEFIGDLTRIEIAKVNSESDFEKEAEVIASKAYVSLSFLQDGTFVYEIPNPKSRGRDTKHYYYDGKESHRIKGFDFVEASGNAIRATAKDENRTTYLINPNNIEERVEIAPYNDTLYYLWEDDVYFIREEKTTGKYDLYEIGINKAKTLIASDVNFYAFTGTGRELYYATNHDPIAYKYGEVHSQNLYLYKDGKAKLITDEAIDIKQNDFAILYNTEKLLKDSGDWERGDFSVHYTKKNYVIAPGSDSAFLVNPVHVEEDGEYNTFSVRYIPVKNGIYASYDLDLGSRNSIVSIELFYAKVADGKTAEEFKSVARDSLTLITLSQDILYFSVNRQMGISYNSLIACKDGETKTLVENLQNQKAEGSLSFRNALVITTEEGNHMLIGPKGEKLHEMKVTDFNFLREMKDPEAIYYVEDKILYRFDGMLKTKVAEEVDWVSLPFWNYWHPTTFSYRYFMEHFPGYESWTNLQF